MTGANAVGLPWAMARVRWMAKASNGGTSCSHG